VFAFNGAGVPLFSAVLAFWIATLGADTFWAQATKALMQSIRFTRRRKIVGRYVRCKVKAIDEALVFE
jgi:hypothetical protein